MTWRNFGLQFKTPKYTACLSINYFFYTRLMSGFGVFIRLIEWEGVFRTHLYFEE